MKKRYMTPAMSAFALQSQDMITVSLTDMGFVEEECDGADWN